MDVLTCILCFTGAPTNYGLYSYLKDKWQGQIANETRGEYNSTYSSDYFKPQKEALTKTRYAVPREQSTSLNKANHINQCLDLRGKPVLQQPELLPTVPPKHVQLTA